MEGTPGVLKLLVWFVAASHGMLACRAWGGRQDAEGKGRGRSRLKWAPPHSYSGDSRGAAASLLGLGSGSLPTPTPSLPSLSVLHRVLPLGVSGAPGGSQHLPDGRSGHSPVCPQVISSSGKNREVVGKRC